VGKLVFWIIVILVVLLGARILGRHAAARQKQAGPENPAARPAARQPGRPAESMVRCAHCGIHLPRSEALMLGGETWCSQEHARLGRPS